MAAYTGQITLVKIKDGTSGQNGVGLVSVKIYYAVSKDGTTPPSGIDGVSNLIINTTNGTLEFNEINSIFRIDNNNIISAVNTISGKPIILTINSESLLGTEGWFETIPNVSLGEFLWIKTVYEYSDGQNPSNDYTQISYSVSKNGEAAYTWIKYADDDVGNGLSDDSTGKKYIGIAHNQKTLVESDDPSFYTWTLIKGADGAPGGEYYIETNQEEILIYVDNDQWSYSPINLTAKILKKENNERIVLPISLDNLTIKVFQGNWTQVYPSDDNDIQVSLKTEIDGQQQYFQIDYEKSFLNETQLWISYLFQDDSYINHIVDKFITIRFGMNKDMAELSVKSNGIVAAIQNTKLTFSKDGLEIKNGGIKIKNVLGEEVLKADEKTGDLLITGTVYAKGGTFKGRIEAEEGYFNGTVQAKDGIIGGFKIGASKLTSTDSLENPSIILDGSLGEIIAQNITLGTGAKIKDYLLLGNGVYILNPLNSNTQSFLVVQDDNGESTINMRSPGYIEIGKRETGIIIDGTNEKIYTKNFHNGKGWEISPTSSTFNDVIVRGSIKASVLEYGEVQTVGGILLVRPSSRIKAIDESGTILTLESAIGFNQNDICLVQQDSFKEWVTIVEVNDNKITINEKIPSECEGRPIVDFGPRGSVGIGINGSTDSAMIPSNSVSVFEFDGQTSLQPKIILGKLPDNDYYGFIKNTYGLYAENALIKGSLITGFEDGGYSGINTIYIGEERPKSVALKNKISEYDKNFQPDDILIWAGAQSADKAGIENSRFFVDRNGYMYAGGGYFSGSIISDAVIRASEIQTVKITGTSKETAALTIEDADEGINFINNGQMVFKISSSRLQAEVDSIVFNTNLKIDKQGQTILPLLQVQKENSSNAFVIRDGNLGLIKNNNAEEIVENLTSLTGLSLLENLINLQVNGKNKAHLNNEELYLEATLNMEESQIVKHGEKMRKEPVYVDEQIIGYDLYVF